MEISEKMSKHQTENVDAYQDLATRIERLTSLIAVRSDQRSKQLKNYLQRLGDTLILHTERSSEGMGNNSYPPSDHEITLTVPSHVDVLEAMINGGLIGRGTMGERVHTDWSTIPRGLSTAVPQDDLVDILSTPSEDIQAEDEEVGTSEGTELLGAEELSSTEEASPSGTALSSSSEQNLVVNEGGAEPSSADLEMLEHYQVLSDKEVFDDPHAGIEIPFDPPMLTEVDGGPDRDRKSLSENPWREDILGRPGALGPNAEDVIRPLDTSPYEDEISVATQDVLTERSDVARATKKEKSSDDEDVVDDSSVPHEGIYHEKDNYEPLEKLASQAHLPVRPQPQAVAIVPKRLAYQAMAAPIRVETDGALCCIAPSDYDPERLGRLSSSLERRVVVIESSQADVVAALDAAYGPAQGVDLDALLLAISDDYQHARPSLVGRVSRWLMNR
ncbi:MAG: hypothetical protein KTR25_00605 [Myxococcales bacterium]|nr:hypothetical protein [Myxococcales bacterium]